MKGEERRGREGILEIEGDCLSNLGILGIYLSLFVFVLRFEFSYRLSTDSRHISPSFSSLSLSPYLPPLFTLLSSFSAVSRPLTSLRSFLLCEYFPSFLSSFLEKKIQEDAYLSLSLFLSALVRTCRFRSEIFEISRLLRFSSPTRTSPMLYFRSIKMSRKLIP